MNSLRLVGESAGQFQGLQTLERDHSARPVRDAARAALRAALSGGSGRDRKGRAGRPKR
jgi:hypothetical protein